MDGVYRHSVIAGGQSAVEPVNGQSTMISWVFVPPFRDDGCPVAPIGIQLCRRLRCPAGMQHTTRCSRYNAHGWLALWAGCRWTGGGEFHGRRVIPSWVIACGHPGWRSVMSHFTLSRLSSIISFVHRPTDHHHRLSCGFHSSNQVWEGKGTVLFVDWECNRGWWDKLCHRALW